MVWWRGFLGPTGRRRRRQHVTTDPACLHYRRPVWVWQRWRHDHMRGYVCWVCLPPVEVEF